MVSNFISLTYQHSDEANVLHAEDINQLYQRKYKRYSIFKNETSVLRLLSYLHLQLLIRQFGSHEIQNG